MIFLHLESFINKLFELDFSILQKACFYGQTPSGRWIFFYGYDIFFFEILASFLIHKSFWKYQTILSNKSNMNQQP